MEINEHKVMITAIKIDFFGFELAGCFQVTRLLEKVSTSIWISIGIPNCERAS